MEMHESCYFHFSPHASECQKEHLFYSPINILLWLSFFPHHGNLTNNTCIYRTYAWPMHQCRKHIGQKMQFAHHKKRSRISFNKSYWHWLSFEIWLQAIRLKYLISFHFNDCRANSSGQTGLKLRTIRHKIIKYPSKVNVKLRQRALQMDTPRQEHCTTVAHEYTARTPVRIYLLYKS